MINSYLSVINISLDDFVINRSSPTHPLSLVRNIPRLTPKKCLCPVPIASQLVKNKVPSQWCALVASSTAHSSKNRTKERQQQIQNKKENKKNCSKFVVAQNSSHLSLILSLCAGFSRRSSSHVRERFNETNQFLVCFVSPFFLFGKTAVFYDVLRMWSRRNVE